MFLNTVFRHRRVDAPERKRIQSTPTAALQGLRPWLTVGQALGRWYGTLYASCQEVSTTIAIQGAAVTTLVHWFYV
ncbi:uncharacterized protein MYCFIDRAFT_173192 [Pseudocercospora fijiensis CIRAD86]|uniref:Uncharacterized protein n=1 Tax=Pseudocercospora fijiensis (strain CIRAD86) TaxID=383855 RepID=M2ZYY5_PSEFD|nr:uncharacterized protein MYCFIDRAFT_173192 [Pseudocercospora fijiensis CIRAD86]EME84149.1 hypothetical protein MYCFIDRAFT_173192 [Pseudocercospora fijiensis CIRAD86]